MDFKTFFIKKIMMSFFVSVTLICFAMALIGLNFDMNTQFGYEAFFSPLIFGLISSLTLLVQYSKKELSVKQAMLRTVIHFILLETVIIAVLFFEGLLTSLNVAITLAVSIFIIYLTVKLILWINDKRIAKEFTVALKKLQNEYRKTE